MQHQSIYVASIEPRSGSLLVSIGIMEMLKGHYEKVAFFRPIIADGCKEDESVTFMIEHFDLKIAYDACVGFEAGKYVEAFAQNRQEELLEALIGKVSALHEGYDFVLIEGYPRDAFSHLFDFDINLAIARNLGTAYVPVLNAHEKTTEQILQELQITDEIIRQEGCYHLVSFVNRCNPDTIDQLKEKFQKEKPDLNAFFIPEHPQLNRPTLSEIEEHLDTKLLIGDTTDLQRIVHGYKIAAMGAENYLTHINNHDLVIVPGDRSEIIMLSLLSYYGKNHPNIAAIVLSGGIAPHSAIMKLIEDFEERTIPMMLVESDSYRTALKLEQIPPRIVASSTQKITLAKALFDEAVDKEKLRTLFKEQPEEILTPTMFLYRLVEKARSDKQRIVLPESDDDRILRAAEIITHRSIADIILLGDEEKIVRRCKALGIDLNGVQITDPNDAKMQESFAQHFYEMRKKKGLTLGAARDAMTHLSYFATMMVYEGMADGMVSGATHTTADTIRPALQIIKTIPGVKIVSSVFFMCLETRVLVYGDCAVNLDPTAEELAQIAISSADTAQQFGIEPKVAMLSYSTGSSGHGPDVEKVRKATQLVQQMRPELLIEGPIQYDAAIDEEVAKKKLPGSKVAGHATVFIFPDLNTGNNTYKAVQRATGALAIGPVLQGLKLPVNDLSRGCSVEDIVNTVAITAIQAHSKVRV